MFPAEVEFRDSTGMAFPAMVNDERGGYRMAFACDGENTVK